MQAYITLGSEKHLRAAQNGFEMVLTTQSFVTGGWGPDEAFGEPNRGQLGDSLRTTHASFETPCGAYGHFKIARYLLRTTKDARYGDTMERVLYNTILGAWPIQPDGTSFYYSDYGTTGRKVWYRDKWPCCSGTFPQLAADYHISTYLRSADGVYVNLFTPSTVHWTEGASKCALTQETNYPFDGKVTLKVAASAAVETTVHVRIPGWASPAPVVAVNGSRVTSGVEPGTFAAIRRTWKDGDTHRARAADAAAPRARRHPAPDSTGPAARAARAVGGRGIAAGVREGRVATSAAGRKRHRRLHGEGCRRHQRRDASIHEDSGRELRHVRVGEVVTPSAQNVVDRTGTSIRPTQATAHKTSAACGSEPSVVNDRKDQAYSTGFRRGRAHPYG